MAFAATPGVLAVLVFIGALCSVAPSASSAAMCPPLRSNTVQVDCVQAGEPFNCTEQPSAPGTVATYRCKPLHQPLFGFLPAAGAESYCRPSGEWSVRPFRCVPICGRPTGRPTALVRDGEEVGSAADYPWHVTIYDVVLDMKQICGGSLVTPKYFVSAAHCFHDNTRALPATRYMAAFAKTKRSATATEPQEQFRPMAKIHMKDYGAKKLHYANDIALVELESEVAVTAWTLPVCVDWSLELPDLRNGEEGTVVGFGNTAYEASETLRFAKLPFVRADDCKKLVDDQLAIFNLLPDKYCVGFVNNTSVAPGDSGGGMAFANHVERAWYLRGVVSVGSSKKTTYSYFTNVTAFVPWISGIIRQGELSGQRCGVDVAESGVVDGAVADRQDFPWEVDVYYKQTSNRAFERLWSGVLIKPNLIITSVVNQGAGDPPRIVDLSEYPASWFRVASRRNAQSALTLDEKVGNVSEVVRLFAPEDVYANQGLFYSFALMELKQPLNLMPVCVDWTGGAQLKTRPLGTTFFETPANNTRMWKRYSTLNANNSCGDSKLSSYSHYFCAAHQGEEPQHRSRTMLVSVDNSWYLRGVWFATSQEEDKSVAIFTDMVDPGVLRWLDTTKDKLGKPTCGNINLCEQLTPFVALPGHMPWNVAVANQRGRVVGSGLLVHPNAVLTAGSILKEATGWEGRDEFPADYAKRMTVLFTEQDGTARTASVLRVSVHENKAATDNGISAVLLELAPEDAIYSTPVCLDLSGNVLQPLVPGQVGMVESWSEWKPSNHSMIGAQFLGSVECTKKAVFRGDPQSGVLFCSEGQKGTIGPVTRGGGYLVNTGAQWFVQGLYVDSVALRRTDLMLAVDLRDTDVRAWLRKRMDKLEIQDPDRLIDAGPKNCEGGKPALSQCGVFESVDQNPQDTGFDILHRASKDHMQWNVKVHVDYGAEGWGVQGGAVVRPNMVLTSGRRLVSGTGANARPISTSDLIVRYISVDLRDKRIVEVDRIHVRARPNARPQDFDLALLVLKTAVDLTPVCLPTAGMLADGTLPRLAAGAIGLVEVGNQDEVLNPLVPVHYRTADECKGLVNDSNAVQQANDAFCAETTVTNLDTGNAGFLPLGYALSVRTNGSWFLRGVLGRSLQSDVHSFASLDDADALEWLASKVRADVPDAVNDSKATTPATSPGRTTTMRPRTTTPSYGPTKSSPFKCGQTSQPLESLSANQSMPGHMPWSVGVLKTNDKGVTFVSAGVLVRENIVITEGVTMTVPQGRWNYTADVRPVELARLRVVWVAPSGKRTRSEVAALHVHERDRGPTTDQAYDVAVLVLKTPIKNSVLACLDLAGEVPTLPPIATGDVGVVETWRGDFFADRRLLLALAAIAVDDCRARLAGTSDEQTITDDRFCTARVTDEVWDGAPFMVRWRGAWFLRGVQSVSVPEGGPHLVTDLRDDSVRDWLRERIPPLIDTSERLPSTPQRPAATSQRPVTTSQRPRPPVVRPTGSMTAPVWE
ncbi:uncharacterized protein LOC117653824 [Thrips palmi]|uniref:Uncharacterized protein LOC117653824 n=1 Tax=Thrips palmi TaxID=161013 RepID=A0A6P9AE91_THRPL|nr:uncharacterized protein LOC117653824 [Thrips palmi]